MEFDYNSIKSLHLIFMVSWFAGLFYMIRLFIYHTEAQTKPEQEKQILNAQFTIMEKKLWWIITTPAMLLTVVFGTFLLVKNEALISTSWMKIKLIFVVVLLVYHFISQKWMFQIQNGNYRIKAIHLRLWNELATLFLVSIVFLAVTKGQIAWWKAVVAFFSVGIGLMLLVKLYKRITAKS